MTEINLKEGCEYSKDKLLELRRKFPAHFNELSCVCPHEESYPQHVIAYRLCIHNEQLDTEDFTPTYRETTRQLDMGDPSTYSVSLFTDINDINFIKTFRKNIDKHAILGAIKRKYGFVRYSPSPRFKSHHDLWLYEYAEPWKDYLDIEEGDSDD